MESQKAPWASKTIIFNVLAMAVAILQTYAGLLPEGE